MVPSSTPRPIIDPSTQAPLNRSEPSCADNEFSETPPTRLRTRHLPAYHSSPFHLQLSPRLAFFTPSHISNMFRQVVASFPRALRTAPRLSANSAALRTQLQSPAATLRAFQPAVSRWYSDAKEAEGDKAAESKEANGATDEVAELKKSLEAKDAEVREWKVGLHTLQHDRMTTSQLTIFFLLLNRTNAFAPLPTSATSRTAPSARSRRRATLPSKSSPRTSSRALTTSTALSPPSRPRNSPTRPRRPRTSPTCTTASR